MNCRRSAVRCLASWCLVLFAACAFAAGQDFDERFESAKVQTWSSDSRADGIAALRELVRERPDEFGSRYELAQVLTWSRETRAEGIDALRALEREFPANVDVAETLARTLSWDSATRDEAIDRLERLVARVPGRTSARLALAEVLSWRRGTRSDAEAIYRDILDVQPGSTGARVGLAQLMSWNGDFESARRLYDEVLSAEPGDPDARIGLAQIEVWTGSPRAALYLLDGLDPQEASDKEAVKAAGEAYEAIGFRTLALDAYGRYVAETPADPWAQRRIERLSDRLRPRLSIGLFVSTESGDPATSRVEWTRLPVSWSWFPVGDLELSVGAEGASFKNARGSSRRSSLGADARLPLGRHVELSGSAWLHGFEDANGEMEGEALVKVTPIDRVTARLGVRRRLLLGSRLTAAGEPIGGLLYGPAVLEELTAGVAVKLTRRWDASVTGGSGSIEGTRINDNDRLWLYGEVGRTFKVRDANLTAKLLVYQLEHDLDLGGFPPAALAGDGISARGVGGYFSPFRFRNHMLQLDASWSHGDRLEFFASGGLGVQQGIDAEDRRFGSMDLSSRGLFVVSWRATDRLVVRGVAQRQDVAAAFDRTRLGGEIVILF